MLESRLQSAPVVEAVVEQPGAGECVDNGVFAVAHPPHGAGFRVDPVQEAFVQRDAAGLGEGRLGQPQPVVNSFPAGAREHGEGVRLQVHRPQLVHARHADVQHTITKLDAPGAGERYLGRVVSRLRELAQPFAVARDRAHRPRAGVHNAERVVSRVGHVEQIAAGRDGEPVRFEEARFVRRAVRESLLAGPYSAQQLPVERGNDDAVVAGVGGCTGGRWLRRRRAPG